MKQLLQKYRVILVYLILALSGGGMDAYSFLCRDYVFANAQTGNILLLGVSLAEQDYAGALKYTWPILAFTGGIILSDIIYHKMKHSSIYWKQITLLVEVVILTLVCWIPQTHTVMANTLASLACGLQVETFRSMSGNTIATTMCIGNLRSGTHNLDKYVQTHNTKYLEKTAVYFGIILFFVLGAVIESALIKIFTEKALYFSVGMLTMACLLMWNEENIYD